MANSEHRKLNKTVPSDLIFSEKIDNSILTFKRIMQCDKLFLNSHAVNQMRNDLETQIENKLKGVHHNKICQIADGRFKTHNPQIIKRTKLELLIALYEYYFHETPLPARKKNTIKSLFPQWMESYKILIEQGHRSVGSQRHYESDYNKYLSGSELETADITAIKFQDIKSFYARITANQAITRKTLNNVKTLVNQIFDYARDQNIPVINTHDIRTMDLCCKEIDNEDKVYSDKEREMVLKACISQNDVYSRCIGLMFCLCVRIGEIKALKWSDVDFENKKVYIHRSMVQIKEDGVYRERCVDRTKGKRKKCNRYENLSDLAITFLKEQRKESAFNEYVFVTNGHPLQTNMINKNLRRLCDRAGVEYLSSHKIRFWAVTAMYDSNLPDYVIQYMAGHADPATTNHYKRPEKLGKKIESDTWNRMFG